MELGLKESMKIGWERIILGLYLSLKYKNAPVYKNPTPDELITIETDLEALGIKVRPVSLSTDEFESFKSSFIFPVDYYGGKNQEVREEKILEHFIAYKFCDIENFTKEDVYVDIAGGESPWAKILREKCVRAYSVDLKTKRGHRKLGYYLQEDAKQTTFNDSSVTACSLQCAYEMFVGDDDWLFLNECNRFLCLNGKVVIVPLYMHTHHCGYSTPEYYRKGYADIGAKEYIRKDSWSIPFSRKYSPDLLKERIMNYVESNRMKYELFKLDNKEELGRGIYCHFILVIKKTANEMNSDKNKL